MSCCQADSDISAYAVEQTLHMQRRQENEAQERKKLTGSGSKRKSVGSARVQQPYFNTNLYSFMRKLLHVCISAVLVDSDVVDLNV